MTVSEPGRETFVTKGGMIKLEHKWATPVRRVLVKDGRVADWHVYCDN
jgi:hypothetical protein